MQTIHGLSHLQETTSINLFFSKLHFTTTTPHHSNKFSSSSSLPPSLILRNYYTTNKSQSLSSPKPNLKKLTSRIVQLTRRKQLHQVFEEVEFAKKRYGKLNTIVMNAVVQACVHCGDIDSALRIFEEMSLPESCGVDSVTFGTLLKGLGGARRVDEAFQLLESLEQGSIIRSPRLSPALIYGLLNSLIEAGDLRRANGLLARYQSVLREEGPSIQMYNLLMKGYINAGFPQDALTVHEEILHKGLKTDRYTYNTLVSACVKSGRMDAAMLLLAQMKDKEQNMNNHDLFPDIVTYTTLLKGFGHVKDLNSVLMIVIEMKSLHDLLFDRVAYTAIIDALLNCGSAKSALCIFGEVQKKTGANPILRPKPHLYLSMMRTFSLSGEYSMVKSLHSRMWPDTAGVISTAVQAEADELLMEAAVNNGQVDVARKMLSDIITKWKHTSWTSRGSMAAVRVEALSGFTRSTFSPYLLPQVSLDDPIETIMKPFEEARPLLANLDVKSVQMRFFTDEVIPIIDEWGSCVGIVYREDCHQLNTPLSSVMRSPPPCVTMTTSIGRVIELLLEKRYKMIIVVKPNYQYETGGYRFNSRAVGVFTSKQLFMLRFPESEEQKPCIFDTST